MIRLLIYIGWIILWEGKVDKPLQRQWISDHKWNSQTESKI